MRGPCCTSRDPPSPDALSPRPASAQPKPVNKLAGESLQLASWGTISDLSKLEFSAELRAIFDNNVPNEPATTQSPSRSKAHGTIDQVRSKLRKHFSRDSGIGLHRSDSAFENHLDPITTTEAGAPEPQKGRGKEVLSSIGLYDEDAKSISLNSIELSIAERRSLAAVGPASMVSLTEK